MVAPDALDLLTYGLQELQGYTDRMHKAVERFRTTGTLPERTFSDLPGPSDSQNGAAKPAAKQTAKQVRAAKAAAAEANGKKPRGLSAFNWYVKAKIAEMKAAGVIPEAEEGKTVNFMTMASAKWKDLGAQGQADFASNFKSLQEQGLIPGPGAGAEAEKKRKAEDLAAAAETTAETAVATKQEAMTETPASPGKSKKKKDAAGSSAQVAASPAGPSTQDDAQEEAPKKKKKKKHPSTDNAAATPAADGAKSEEKKKKKHKKKNRDSIASAATAN